MSDACAPSLRLFRSSSVFLLLSIQDDDIGAASYVFIWDQRGCRRSHTNIQRHERTFLHWRTSVVPSESPSVKKINKYCKQKGIHRQRQCDTVQRTQMDENKHAHRRWRVDNTAIENCVVQIRISPAEDCIVVDYCRQFGRVRLFAQFQLPVRRSRGTSARQCPPCQPCD